MGADPAAEGVWFPETSSKEFWLTSDGRLFAFDYAEWSLEDHTGDLTFDAL